MSIGPAEFVVIVLILLLLFGSKRLTDMGKGLGDGIRNFKRGLADDGAATASEKTPPAEPKQLPPHAEPAAGLAEAGQESKESGLEVAKEQSAEKGELLRAESEPSESSPPQVEGGDSGSSAGTDATPSGPAGVKKPDESKKSEG